VSLSRQLKMTQDAMCVRYSNTKSQVWCSVVQSTTVHSMPCCFLTMPCLAHPLSSISPCPVPTP
jgi:hypothetical protein